jgi:hypothetical protein
MLRWYEMPVEEKLPAEDYLARAERFHRVAQGCDPLIGARFEAMAVDALEIARRKQASMASSDELFRA